MDFGHGLIFLFNYFTFSDDSSEKHRHDLDPGTKSEGEEDGGSKKSGLGRTPNHLTLSTTSTLSAGSTGSQARLIQSSQQPQNYQPPPTDLGNICAHCHQPRLSK